MGRQLNCRPGYDRGTPWFVRCGLPRSLIYTLAIDYAYYAQHDFLRFSDILGTAPFLTSADH